MGIFKVFHSVNSSRVAKKEHYHYKNVHSHFKQKRRKCRSQKDNVKDKV